MHTQKCNNCGKTDLSLSHFNHDIIDGEPSIQFDRQPEIKIAHAPKIVFAVPIGAKRLDQKFQCTKDDGGCGLVWEDRPTIRALNMVPVQFMLNYHQLQMPLNVTTTMLVESGRLSSEARQIITKKAIRMGAKYIIYWDDDILVPADAVYRLYNFLEKNPKVGIASAVCNTRHPEFVEPVIYKVHGEGATWDFECGEGAKPEQIFAAGAGFMMARVSAIEAVIEKLKADNDGHEVPVWADEKVFKVNPAVIKGVSQFNQFWGHDVRFCRLMQEAGYYVFVHGAVLTGHLDATTGHIYTLPDDAPGFAKVKERLDAEKAQRESGQSDGRIQAGDVAVEQRPEGH